MNRATAGPSGESALRHTSPAVDVPDTEAEFEAFVRRAVSFADSNSLRVALYQATGDEELLTYEQYTEVLRKGALEKLTIVERDRPALEEKAVQFLLEHRDGFTETVPSDEELRKLFALFSGTDVGEIAEGYVKSQRALVGFDEYPYFARKWREGGGGDIPEGFYVAIIGTGFSGISAAVQLSLLGIPYVIFERREEIGGTWSINRYPDVRVDTMSASYQLGFIKRYPWTEHFARGADVREYVEHAAREHGVIEHIRFGHDIKSLTFDEKTSRWDIEVVHKGNTEHIEAPIVVSATGLFGTPRLPDFPGLEDFRGDIIHTTKWPEGYPLEGKRVALIGNGSTGVQLMPGVARRAEHLSVFVRTPQWISPREYYGDPIEEEHQWLIRAMPYYWHWERFTWSVSNMGALVAKIFFRDQEWIAKGGQISEANDKLRDALIQFIKDETDNRPELYERLIPDHPPWSRRMIVDGGWYRTLTEDHVDLVTESIDHLEADAIVTKDGKRHPVDVIVAASGFEVSKYMFPIKVRGRDGIDLHESWDESEHGPRAYLSMLVPKFPNLFIMYGPNSQGGAPFPANMELWARCIAELTMQLLDGGYREFEVKEDVFEKHNEVLDARTSRMIFADAGERNYYMSHGRVGVMAAWSAEEHWENMTNPDIERDFRLE